MHLASKDARTLDKAHSLVYAMIPGIFVAVCHANVAAKLSSSLPVLDAELVIYPVRT
jgi:hypothetical protein